MAWLCRHSIFLSDRGVIYQGHFLLFLQSEEVIRRSSGVFCSPSRGLQIAVVDVNLAHNLGVEPVDIVHTVVWAVRIHDGRRSGVEFSLGAGVFVQGPGLGELTEVLSDGEFRCRFLKLGKRIGLARQKLAWLG